MTRPAAVSQRRVLAAGAIGNTLEWYDFAIGYLMRPLGGVLVGHIGDRHGRRVLLVAIGLAAAAAVPLLARLRLNRSRACSRAPLLLWSPDTTEGRADAAAGPS